MWESSLIELLSYHSWSLAFNIHLVENPILNFFIYIYIHMAF